MLGLSQNTSGGETMVLPITTSLPPIRLNHSLIDSTKSAFLAFVSMFVTRGDTLPCLFLRKVEARFCLVVDLKPSSIHISCLAGLERLLYAKPPWSFIHLYEIKYIWMDHHCTASPSLPLVCMLLKLSSLGLTGSRFVEG